MAKSTLPAPRDLRAKWQIDNATMCGCAGTDDMCPCQNDPDHFKPKPSRDDLTDEIAALTAALARLREALERIAGSAGLFAEPASGQHAREIACAVLGAHEARAFISSRQRTSTQIPNHHPQRTETRPCSKP